MCSGIPEGTYELKIGASFLGSSKSRPPEFNTLRFDFKPASISTDSSEAYIVQSQNQNGNDFQVVVLGEAQKQTVFKGAKKDIKGDKECLLVFNKESKELCLERVSANISVKKTRDVDLDQSVKNEMERLQKRKYKSPQKAVLEPVVEPERKERTFSASSAGDENDEEDEENVSALEQLMAPTKVEQFREGEAVQQQQQKPFKMETEDHQILRESAVQKEQQTPQKQPLPVKKTSSFLGRGGRRGDDGLIGKTDQKKTQILITPCRETRAVYTEDEHCGCLRLDQSTLGLVEEEEQYIAVKQNLPNCLRRWAQNCTSTNVETANCENRYGEPKLSKHVTEMYAFGTDHPPPVCVRSRAVVGLEPNFHSNSNQPKFSLSQLFSRHSFRILLTFPAQFKPLDGPTIDRRKFLFDLTSFDDSFAQFSPFESYYVKNLSLCLSPRNNEFRSYANLKRHRIGGGGGGGQFLFSRRLYDVNKGEESSLCDLLLDNERDSGAGTSLCGSSTGGSSQRRRSSAPLGLHHHPHSLYWHYHPNSKQQQQHIASSLQQHHSSSTTYRPHSQVGAGVGAVRRSPREETAKTTLPVGQSKRRAVLLEVRKVAEMAAESVATPTQPKEKVILGGRTTPAATMEVNSFGRTTTAGTTTPEGTSPPLKGNNGTAEGGGPAEAIVATIANGHQHHPRLQQVHDEFLLAQSQPSTSGTVIPLALDNVQQQQQFYVPGRRSRPESPAVFINLGRAEEANRRWWHRRNRGGRHAGNSTSTVDVADRRVPSVFVLEDGTGRNGYLRKWRAHTGRNRFFCDGRLMLARQSSVFLLTLFLIIFTMALFCVYDLPYLTEHVSLAIPIVSGLLFSFVMATLFKTAFSDPGIVPRASPREVLEWEQQCQETDPYFNADEWAQPRTRVVNIRGQPVKLKYCFTCCIFRPPRSSHCSICDNCVLNFDHHCPWVGNCIGLRNYRHFYLFICSLSVLDAFLGVSVGIHLYLSSLEKGSFVEAVKVSPASMLTGLINIISIWSVLGLSGFHTYLIALGQTTNEDIKGTFNRKLHPQVKNPYSSGNCVKNLIATLCAPERPSLLDRRGWHPPNDKGAAIFVDAVILDEVAAKRRLNGANADVDGCGAKSLQAVANGRTKCGGGDGARRAHAGGGSPSVAASSPSCPPSPPRQQRRNAMNAKADDPNSNHLSNDHLQCHRVIIPQSSTLPMGPRSNNNGGIARGTPQQQQQRQRTTMPMPTTTVAHRICHGNNLVAPMADNKSNWSLSSSITRNGKGRRSMTMNGNAESRRDEARRSPLSLVDEPHRHAAAAAVSAEAFPTLWRRRSESIGEIANWAQMGRGEGEGGQ
uniref:protein S-acyltransferase n=1 Tax=Globodera rostochiensis TaxID=31243 RepID=A0A914I1M0_GLORO